MFAQLLIILSLVGVLSFPTLARLPQAAKDCSILAPIKLSETEAPVMVNIIVSSYVKNCSPVKKTYRVIGGQTATCGQQLVFADGNISLNPGEGTSIKASTLSAPDDCPGPVYIAIVAFDDDKIIAKVTTTLKGK